MTTSNRCVKRSINSGADTSLTCELAEKLFTLHGKDVRVATYYIWARLHRDGETGLADGLALLAGLISRFGETLYPLRAASRKPHWSGYLAPAYWTVCRSILKWIMRILSASWVHWH